MPAFKNRKKNIIENYQVQRARSLKMQQVLSHYILSNNSQKDEFIEGMTYGQYLKFLQKNHILYLSDKNYGLLKKSNNRLLLKQTYNNMAEQENILSEAEIKLSYLLEQDAQNQNNNEPATGQIVI